MTETDIARRSDALYHDDCAVHRRTLCDMVARLEDENAELRELVRDMWHDGMCECDERNDCETCEYGYLDRMRDLGVEVE